MTLKLSFDPASVQRVSDLLDEMSENIKQFGAELPEGLTQWQTDDMHRKYPNTDVVGDNAAMTKIWPTSRVNMMKDSYRTVVTRSRPILRRELFEVLCQRMDQRAEAKLKWR